MVVQGFSAGSRSAPPRPARSAGQCGLAAAFPIDDLAGDAVLSACEKRCSARPSRRGGGGLRGLQITLLISLGDVATANKGAGSDLLALRRAVERDRYGLMAYVLTTRDRCTRPVMPAVPLVDQQEPDCGQHGRAPVREPGHALCALLERAAAGCSGLLAGLPPSMPTGNRPTPNSRPRPRPRRSAS